MPRVQRTAAPGQPAATFSSLCSCSTFSSLCVPAAGQFTVHRCDTRSVRLAAVHKRRQLPLVVLQVRLLRRAAEDVLVGRSVVDPLPPEGLRVAEGIPLHLGHDRRELGVDRGDHELDEPKLPFRNGAHAGFLVAQRRYLSLF